MCIICVSPKGVRQPNISTIRTMFRRNPHGAGYMCIRDGKVFISKGYMYEQPFIDVIQHEHFTAKDAVVYHFRISTQAGVRPEMTHPFPLSKRLSDMDALDVFCRCGIAHNGIIKLTSDAENKRYSDTAIFITEYLADLIRKPDDLHNPYMLRLIKRLAGSKLAIMDASGEIITIGDFVNDHGLLYSNYSFTTFARRAS
jgi:predicted glutamine amidotransferase